MEQNIRDFIIGFFVNRDKISLTEAEVFCSSNFIEAQVLDSIEFITMIAEIEENFDITFTEAEIQSPEFSSINGLVRIAASRVKS